MYIYKKKHISIEVYTYFLTCTLGVMMSHSPFITMLSGICATYCRLPMEMHRFFCGSNRSPLLGKQCFTSGSVSSVLDMRSFRLLSVTMEKLRVVSIFNQAACINSFTYIFNIQKKKQDQVLNLVEYHYLQSVYQNVVEQGVQIVRRVAFKPGTVNGLLSTFNQLIMP